VRAGYACREHPAAAYGEVFLKATSSVVSITAIEGSQPARRRILTPEGAAEYLGIDPRTASRSTREGHLSFYTAGEVAAILKISTDSVIRKFSDVPGVIDLGSPEKGKKRQYRVLRIPREALERFIAENRVA
jgi:hypothetical protein